ncbi:MAG: S8 family serine peptidase [Chitinophagales bacterium]
MNKIRYIIINSLIAAIGYVVWQAWRSKQYDETGEEDIDDFIGEPSPIFEEDDEDFSEDFEDFDDFDDFDDDLLFDEIEDEILENEIFDRGLDDDDDIENEDFDMFEDDEEPEAAAMEDEDWEEVPQPSEDREISEEDEEPVPAPDIALEEGLAWQIADYHINEIWADAKGEKVKVAMLDSGICLTHPDLSFEATKDFTADTGDANDNDGHGTHCAGIVCAKGQENAEVLGIAPKVKLYVAKIAESDFDVTNERIYAALKWAINVAKADIVSMSFSVRVEHDGIKQLLNRAKDRVIFVGATSKYPYPATYDNCIGVADMDQECQTNENFHKYKAVDIVAPGINIQSTFTDPPYKLDSGSSMATAYVTGVLALLKSYAIANNLEVSPEKYAQIIEETATANNDFKIVNPLAALNQLKTLIA